MKRIIAIGGGEIKNKTTLKIDEYIAGLIKKQAKDGRGNALFIGAASHDSMPYFNSFRKTYTSIFDIKADVALTVYGEMDGEKIKAKIEKADAIYLGGGDTLYMLNKLKELNIDKLLATAYESGTILTGLSAGAICWFQDMYTDSEISGTGQEYTFQKGLGYLDGLMTPHYDNRLEDFDRELLKSPFTYAYAVENDCAIEFIDGKFTKSISSGKKAYYIKNNGKELLKEEI